MMMFEATTKKAISAVKKFTSRDETRHTLRHVLIESTNGAVQAVATDGHRLAFVKLADKEAFDRAGYYCEDGVEKPATDFPQWRRVVPSGEVKVTAHIDRKDFQEWLEVRLAADRAAKKVKVAQLKASLESTPKTHKKERDSLVRELAEARGESSVLISLAVGAFRIDSDILSVGAVIEASEAVTVRLNTKYLLEAVTFAKGDALTIEVRDYHSPIVVYPQGKREERFMLVMPMRQ